MQVHRSHAVQDNAPSCDLDLASRSNQIFLENAFPPKLLAIAASNFVCHMVWRILGNVLCLSLTSKFKVKSEIMYFLVNASPPKRLDLATSNFADALVRSKAGICDGVPSTEV